MTTANLHTTRQAALMLALVFLVTAPVACSRKAAERVGRVRVALTVAGGVSIDAVAYRVLAADHTELLAGVVDVGGTDTLTFDLALPPGARDTVALSAVSSSSPIRTFGGVSAPFNVFAGQAVAVDVILTDGSGGALPPGVAIVNGVVQGNRVPTITSATLSPTSVTVGGTIQLQATATDPDPGDTVSYLWTVEPTGAAVVAEPSAAVTTLSSPSPASEFAGARLTVSDGHGGTSASGFLPFRILGPIEPPFEPCSEQPGAAAPQCTTCTTANCALGTTGTDGCCGLASAADQVLCANVLRCVDTNAAACVQSGDSTNCFCGTAGPACFSTAGAANGPCVGDMAAAAKTSAPQAIQGEFSSPTSPLGRAVNLISCRGTFCSAECDIP